MSQITQVNRVKILIMDAYCASHVGNDVLLESSMLHLRSMYKDPEFIIHAKTPNAFEESLGIKCCRRLFPNPPPSFIGKLYWLFVEVVFMSFQWINMSTVKIPPRFFSFGIRRTAVRDYEECDIAVSIGGEMLGDSFRKILPMYLFLFWFAHKCGSKTIIFPQSIGPLKRRWTRWLTRTVLQKLTIVMPRDKPSAIELEGLGLSGNQALYCPDVGLAQPRDSDEDSIAYLESIGIKINKTTTWIGLTISPWVEEGISKNSYLDEIVEALTCLSKSRKIGVLVMPANMPVNGGLSKDYDTSLTLKGQISSFCDCVILEREVISARRFKGVAAQFDLFISTRMHAAILSTMAATPTITINTQRKLRGYMTMIGQEDFALDISNLDSNKILASIEKALDEGEEIRVNLLAAREQRQEEQASYFQKAARILQTE